MAIVRTNEAQTFRFGLATDWVTVIPEGGATYTLDYLSGSDYIPGGLGEQSGQNKFYVLSTIVKITPVGGYITVAGAGSFDKKYVPGPKPEPVPAGAPVNTQQASFSPSPASSGDTVTADEGEWTSETPIDYTYQWQLAGANIVGATLNTLLILPAMIGSSLRCVVTATNSVGSATSTTTSSTVVEVADFVASLDGNQAWETSEQLIDVDNLDGLSLKGNFPSSEGIFFANGSGSDFRIYEGASGKITAQIGGNYTTDFADAVAGMTEFLFTDTTLTYLVDGVELWSGTFNKGAAKGTSATVLGGRVNGDRSVSQGKTGVVSNVNISQSGTALFDSELTDKALGSVQVSTVGAVTATLVNYDVSVWIPYVTVAQYANLNGTSQAWSFDEKLIDVDNLDGTEIQAHFFEDSEGTLIGQSLGGSSDREFQYYKFSGELGLRIGGQVDDLKLGDLATIGVHKLSFSGSNVTVTINDIEIYSGPYVDGGKREAGAVTTVGKRGGGNFKAGGAADFIIKKGGVTTYENTLTNRDDLGINVPLVGTALATLENFNPSVWTNRFITDADIPTPKFILFSGASIMERSFDQTSRTEGVYSAAGLDITTFCRALGGDTSINTYIKAKEVAAEFAMVTKERYALMHTGGNDVSLYGPYPVGDSEMQVNVAGAAQSFKAAGFKLIMTPISYRIPPASNPTAPYNLNVMDALISTYADHQIDMYNFTLDSGDAYFGTLGGDGIHPSNPDGEILTINYVVDNTFEYIQA